MGYIKLHRKILEWEWYGEPNMIVMWLHLLLSANYEDKTWRGVLVERGSFMTSISALSSETGLSIQEVRTCLKKLQSSKQINIKSTRQATKVTICNYDSYQCRESDEQQTINTRSNSKTTTTKEDNTSSSTNVDSEDIIKKEKKDAKASKEKEIDDAVERLYKLYPTKCPIQGRRTGKSSADKRKLASLLKTHTPEHLERLITAYLQESLRTQTYIMDFSKFLNRLPDYTESDGALFQGPVEPLAPKKLMTLEELKAKEAAEREIARRRFEQTKANNNATQ